MFNRYNFNPFPKPLTIQDILAGKAKMQQAQMQQTSPTIPLNTDPLSTLDRPVFDNAGPTASLGNIPIQNPIPVAKSAFDFGQAPTPAQSIPQKQTDWMSKYEEATRRTQLDEYLKQLANPPNREQFKPSGWDKAGSMMVGFATGFRNPAAGYEVGKSILDRGFNEAEADYQERLKRTALAAQLEGQVIDDKTRILDVGRKMEEDDRDYQMRVREFEQRTKQLEQNGWELKENELTGTLDRVNKVTGQIIPGPKRNESLEEKTKREKDIADAEAKVKKDIAEIGVAGREEVARINAESRKQINQAKLAAAAVKLQYQPMSESQRKAGLNTRLQNLISQGVDYSEYTDYDPITQLYSLKEDSGISSYFMDETEKARRANERALVAAALRTPGAINTPTNTPTPTPTAKKDPLGIR